MVQRRDVFCMAHMSRREYRMKKEHGDHNADVAKNKYAQTKENYRRNFAEKRSHQMQTSNLMNVNSRQDYHHVKLNFWKIFSDRPYVSVAILVGIWSPPIKKNAIATAIYAKMNIENCFSRFFNIAQYLCFFSFFSIFKIILRFLSLYYTVF